MSSSPIVRRVRRSEASKTSLQPAGPGQYIKKSVSMDSVPSGELTDQDHRPKIQDQNLREAEEKFDELVKIIDKNGVSGSELSASYSTLPQSFSRSRNISRSLVPKMRKFFEKSRSCGPELHHPADGTESARSSFVLVAPGDNPGNDPQDQTQATNSVTGSSLTLDDVTDERARQMKNKGFVNKCVVKVRSLMGRSQEMD